MAIPGIQPRETPARRMSAEMAEQPRVLDRLTRRRHQVRRLLRSLAPSRWQASR